MAVEKQFPITIRKATAEDVQHIFDCLREALGLIARAIRLKHSAILS